MFEILTSELFLKQGMSNFLLSAYKDVNIVGEQCVISEIGVAEANKNFNDAGTLLPLFYLSAECKALHKTVLVAKI